MKPMRRIGRCDLTRQLPGDKGQGEIAWVRYLPRSAHAARDCYDKESYLPLHSCPFHKPCSGAERGILYIKRMLVMSITKTSIIISLPLAMSFN